MLLVSAGRSTLYTFSRPDGTDKKGLVKDF